MANILGVGIATLDIINRVSVYPAEDVEVRALSQTVQRGGNATNTLVVLSQLGHHCTWLGTLGDDAASEIVVADLATYGIDTGAVEVIHGGRTPTSYITLSEATGSRTIVHYRDLPELSTDAFFNLDLANFQWLHIEGRDPERTLAMLDHARSLVPDIPVSVEIEKSRPGIEAIFASAGLLLYSRPYVESQGFTPAGGGAPEFLRSQSSRFPQATHVCTWGAEGAYAIEPQGINTEMPPNWVHHSKAIPPPTLVETLAAGDTFNAGLISALLESVELPMALKTANALAGRKCGQAGLANLV